MPTPVAKSAKVCPKGLCVKTMLSAATRRHPRIHQWAKRIAWFNGSRWNIDGDTRVRYQEHTIRRRDNIGNGINLDRAVRDGRRCSKFGFGELHLDGLVLASCLDACVDPTRFVRQSLEEFVSASAGEDHADDLVGGKHHSKNDTDGKQSEREIDGIAAKFGAMSEPSVVVGFVIRAVKHQVSGCIHGRPAADNGGCGRHRPHRGLKVK